MLFLFVEEAVACVEDLDASVCSRACRSSCRALSNSSFSRSAAILISDMAGPPPKGGGYPLVDMMEQKSSNTRSECMPEKTNSKDIVCEKGDPTTFFLLPGKPHIYEQ